MESLSDFLTWAWARHHNVLSWYIRPLFVIPLVFFAYKRNWKGLVITIVALFTSMFWFPAPEIADPSVEQFLQVERDYILGKWNIAKALWTLTVPAFFYFLILAFWKRSLWWGLAVINLAALGKITWSVLSAGEAGLATLGPALIGMLVCDAAVYFGVKFVHNKQVQKATSM
jgi:hypothetical protein